MKKIVFIIPPIKEKIWSNHYHEIYIGIAYIANLVSRKGFYINLIDCDANSISLLQLQKKIKNFNPDFIGLTALYGSLGNAIKISKIIRKISQAPIIMGGIPATFIPDYILNNSLIDILVRGEGELTFMDILSEKPLNKINGISYKQNGLIYHNKNRDFIQNLDDLGIPKRDIFPLKKYKIPFKTHNSTAIETSRGCPYCCDFCTQSPKEGRQLRLRSPEMVLTELKDISRKYSFIKRIMFLDNDFLTNSQHSKKILQLIIKNNLNKRFHFMIATRIENMLRGGKHLILLMKQANVGTIFFGIESVSDKYKKSIGKVKNEQDTIRLFRKLESIQIDPLPSYIIGYPGENNKDINQTLNFAKKLNTKIFSFNILTPYPGTKLYNECIKKNQLIDPEYTNLDNAHQVIKHKINLRRKFNQLHRSYMFRKKYFNNISFFNFLKKDIRSRIVFFVYYLVFMELATYLRDGKRRIYQFFQRKNRFEK